MARLYTPILKNGFFVVSFNQFLGHEFPTFPQLSKVPQVRFCAGDVPPYSGGSTHYPSPPPSAQVAERACLG